MLAVEAVCVSSVRQYALRVIVPTDSATGASGPKKKMD